MQGTHNVIYLHNEPIDTEVDMNISVNKCSEKI